MLGQGPYWIAFGIIVGLLARRMVPGDPPTGIAGDVIVGVLGAFLGVWLYGRYGPAGTSGLNLPTMVCAFIAAVVLLWVLRLFGGRSSA